MTEDSKDLNVEDAEETIEETVNTPEKKDAPKMFTQAEVNEIVKGRLAKEKKANDGLNASWETEKTEMTSKIESYEKIVKNIIDVKKSDIPENFRKLFDKLSIQEQFDWLNDPANKLADKKVIPTTPNATEHKNNDAVMKLRKI